jgi:lipoprotein-anchoring transpeptidase ErfK/SrfK
MLSRRGLLAGLFGLVVAGPVAMGVTAGEAEAWHLPIRRRRRKTATRNATKKKVARAGRPKRKSYGGRSVVSFATNERPGTIIIKTSERALYKVMGGGKAMRYLVAVGKEGFSWSGVARVGSKAVNPRWTPPPEMIERTPKYAKWAGGMPGGIPQNPLGVRALYLYRGKRDTGFRIHGTNAPSSIGTAASSGCIRMLNHEVIELYNATRIGTKVIVI